MGSREVVVGDEILVLPDSMSEEAIRKAVEARYPSKLKVVMDAVAEVETGGEEDKFIRTHDKNAPPKGSTAYGPLQVTLGLASDYLDRKAELFDEDEVEYLEKYVAQGWLFNEYGREKGKKGYEARYDYSGVGYLNSKGDKEMYWKVFTKVFKDRVGGDYSAESVAKKWHGGTDKKKIKHYASKLVSAGASNSD